MIEQQDIETATDRASWIYSNLKQAQDHSAQWRKEARMCFDFRAGKQWSDEDIAQMELARKPVITFNRIERAVRAVIGLEIQNRQDVRYMPRGVEDTGISEVLHSAADWIRDNSDAEDEESEAFADLITSGMGWACSELDYESSPDGMVKIERVDPLDMFWDPSSRSKNLRDARWIAHIKRVTADDIRGMWPDYAEAIDGSGTQQFLDRDDQPHDATPPFYTKDRPSDSVPRSKELVCYQWWERVTYHRIASVDGSTVEVSHDQWQMAQQSAELLAQIVQHVEQKRRVYRVAYCVDGKLIEEKESPIQKSGFTYKCITGARDRNRNTWFGLVWLMLDPQRFANKWLSQITHILNKSAKGGLIAEMDAFTNQKMAQESWAKTEMITWAAPGAVSGGKIQPKPAEEFPNGFGQLLEFAVNSIDNVPGISAEILGMTGQNQPGIVEESRKRAGFTILAIFFDSIRLYRKEHGRLLAEYIQKYLSDGRLIRVVGPQGAKNVPLVRMPDGMEYDVIVDESPTSPNAKERTFSMMTQLGPILQQAGVPLPPDILDYSPLPSSLVEKWKAHIEQTKQLPPQVQMAMEQMQQTVQAQQAEIGKLAADKLKLQTNMQVDLYKVNKQAEVDREVAELRARTEADKAAVEVYKANLDAMLQKMDMVAGALREHAQSQMEARQQTVVTEAAAGPLMQNVQMPLQKIMEATMQQMTMFQQLPGVFDALAERIGSSVVESIGRAVSGSRLVESEPINDPATGRLSGIRRRFADGSEDVLPYRRGQQTLQ